MMAIQFDLRLGSEFLVLIHHLAQAFGTVDVHRIVAILSVYQAGDLFQMLHHVKPDVVITK